MPRHISDIAWNTNFRQWYELNGTSDGSLIISPFKKEKTLDEKIGELPPEKRMI